MNSVLTTSLVVLLSCTLDVGSEDMELLTITRLEDGSGDGCGYGCFKVHRKNLLGERSLSDITSMDIIFKDYGSTSNETEYMNDKFAIWKMNRHRDENGRPYFQPRLIKEFKVPLYSFYSKRLRGTEMRVFLTRWYSRHLNEDVLYLKFTKVDDSDQFRFLYSRAVAPLLALIGPTEAEAQRLERGATPPCADGSTARRSCCLLGVQVTNEMLGEQYEFLEVGVRNLTICAGQCEDIAEVNSRLKDIIGDSLVRCCHLTGPAKKVVIRYTNDHNSINVTMKLGAEQCACS